MFLQYSVLCGFFHFSKTPINFYNIQNDYKYYEHKIYEVKNKIWYPVCIWLFIYFIYFTIFQYKIYRKKSKYYTNIKPARYFLLQISPCKASQNFYIKIFFKHGKLTIFKLIFTSICYGLNFQNYLKTIISYKYKIRLQATRVPFYFALSRIDTPTSVTRRTGTGTRDKPKEAF